LRRDAGAGLDERKLDMALEVTHWARRGVAYGTGLFAAGYAAYAGVAWLRDGHVQPAAGDEGDPVLGRFMPRYDVGDRHHVRVAAPADVLDQVRREAERRARDGDTDPEC
jgi:hypothetical protein